MTSIDDQFLLNQTLRDNPVNVSAEKKSTLSSPRYKCCGSSLKTGGVLACKLADQELDPNCFLDTE